MRRTRSLVPILLLLWHVCTAAAASAASVANPATPASIAKDGWPETELGRLARQWTQAFSKGESAMREALPRLLSPESLAKRSVDARIESYRTMHERFGSLMLVSIDSVGVGALKVTMSASDMSPYQFLFLAQPGPPARLRQITLFDRRAGGHSGGDHH